MENLINAIEDLISDEFDDFGADSFSGENDEDDSDDQIHPSKSEALANAIRDLIDERIAAHISKA